MSSKIKTLEQELEKYKELYHQTSAELIEYKIKTNNDIKRFQDTIELTINKLKEYKKENE